MSLSPYFASSSKVWDTPEWVFGIEESGYVGWEICAEGNYRLDRPKNVSSIRDIIDSTTLAVSVHAPYTDLNIASLNYPIYRESIQQTCRCIEGAAEFTDRVTLHPGYFSPAGKLVPDRVWDLQKSALIEIGRYSADCGVLTCLENMINIEEFLCRNPEEVFGMAEGIEGIGITFDIGHANTVGVVDGFLSRITHVHHVHLHDNGGIYDEHLALGDGSIDWLSIGPIIARDFSGICVVEGRNLNEAKRSLDVFRRCFV
jgi:sugar phosphate isomerase/epimerase